MRKVITRGVLVAVVIAAAASVIYLRSPRDTPSPASLQALAVGEMAALQHTNPPKAVLGSFVDAGGKSHSIADFRGKVLLVNFWATWCAPCREEMPALEAVEKAYGGEDFAVLAISLDRKGVEKVQAFYDEMGLSALPIYLDANGQFSRGQGVSGLPVTLLIDRKGREVARLVGAADWAGENARKLIQSLLSEQ